MRLFGILSAVLFGSVALAAPARVPLQGVLVDAEGERLEGQATVIFRVYDLDQPTEPVWESERQIEFRSGFFSVLLGDQITLERDLFLGADDFVLTLAIDGDDETDPLPIGSAPFALDSEYAREAASLEGATLTDILDQIPDQASLDASITAVCYDQPSELTAVLDSVYMPISYLPNWMDLQDIPADLADGDQNTEYTNGTGLLLDGTELSVDQALVEDWALAVTNAPGALDATIEEYLTNVYAPSYLDIGDFPPDLLDGDDDTTYQAGDGLFLVGDTFSVDAASVQMSARAVCYDTIDELRGALDSAYLGATWRPAWTDVQNIPADLLDGDDNTTYTAGNGLTLSGEMFEVDAVVIQDLAKLVAYDAESELLAVLDDDYKPLSYQPDFTEIQNLPDWLADGDDDTLAALNCSSGQLPKWDGAEWMCSDATFSGDLSVGGGLSVGGDLDVTGSVGASGAVIGTLEATTSSLGAATADSMDAASADITSLSAGSVNADSVAATGTVSGGSLSATGAVTAGSASVSGLVEAGSVAASGAVTSASVGTGSLDVSGTVTGAGFDGWDRNASDDLLQSASFGGDVSGTFDNLAVANDSHTHGDATISNDISISNGLLHAPADGAAVGIGTTAPSGDMHIRDTDAQAAELFITGFSQGSGMVYVGQSLTHGGGIRYDGDSTPAPTGTADHVTFFRRNAGTDTVVFEYSYATSTVDFTGSVNIAGNLDVTGTIYGNVSMYAVGTTITASARCATCTAGDSLIGCSTSNLDNCAGNPCDADLSPQPTSNRCCASTGDHSGWRVYAYCLND